MVVDIAHSLPCPCLPTNRPTGWCATSISRARADDARELSGRSRPPSLDVPCHGGEGACRCSERFIYTLSFIYCLAGRQVTLRWWEEMADDADSRDTAPLIRRAKFTPARAVAVVGVGFVGLLGLLALAHPPTAVEASSSPPFARMSNASAGCTLPKTGTIDIYIGNGCFWCLAAPTPPGRGTNSLALTHLHSPTRTTRRERQWAYINVEKAAPFSRPRANLTSLVGYAGGTTVGSEVCCPVGRRGDHFLIAFHFTTTSHLLPLPTSYHFPPPTTSHLLPLPTSYESPRAPTFPRPTSCCRFATTRATAATILDSRMRR